MRIPKFLNNRLIANLGVGKLPLHRTVLALSSSASSSSSSSISALFPLITLLQHQQNRFIWRSRRQIHSLRSPLRVARRPLLQSNSIMEATNAAHTGPAGEPLTNKCLDSKSPYVSLIGPPPVSRTISLTTQVRSHAKNPTAWQLWTPETLELARRTNKLLFVSIGYSACHWCHVMAHESFDNPQIARLLNENFIPIKIDREERPDIDRVYMDFLQATTGGGGWPLNVFVTPELQPLFGGTYWPGPNHEMSGRGGSFALILEKVASAWSTQEAKCREDARRITDQLKQFAQEGTLNTPIHRTDGAAEGESSLPDLELLEDAYEHHKLRYDDKYAGFGGAPKFPTPAHLSFLLRLGRFDRTVNDIVGEEEIAAAQEMAVATLKAMAKGGIKDQIGHGFSRYSVTRDWSLPHFEKMLYDNAQLLNAYLDAYLLTNDPLLLDTVHDVATYLISAPVQSKTGGFHASEDADSAPSSSTQESKEGAFYVWSFEEFGKVIGDEKAAAICADYYNVKPEGNVNPRYDVQGELEGLNTLCISATIEELAAKHSLSEQEVAQAIALTKARLLECRDTQRPRPHLDDKIVTSWNGLAISALARVATAVSLDAPDAATAYLGSAIGAAEFIRSSLYDPSSQTLLRVFREGPGSVPGFADDYAFLISGLLDLYTATSDERWLNWAYELQVTQIKLFYDEERSGGFYSTPKDSQDILIRSKDAMDNAEPSTNGVSALNLFRLSALLDYTGTGSQLGDKPQSNDFHSLAVRTVKNFEVELGQHPGLMSGLLSAVVLSRLGLKSVLITGTGPLVDAAVRELCGGVWPGAVMLRVPGSGVGEWLRGKNEVLAQIDPSREMVQVCAGTQCSLVQQPGDLAKLLSGS